MKHRIFWTEQKIRSRLPLLRPLVHRRSAPIRPFRYRKLPGPEAPAPIAPEIDDHDWEEIPFDSYWGEWSTDFVLRSRFRIPEGFGTDGPLALYLPLGEAGDIFCHPEALAYIDGRLAGSADRHHQELALPPDLPGEAEYALALHGWTGLSGWPPDPTSTLRLFMRPCRVVEIDAATRDLTALVSLCLDVVDQMADGNTARDRILRALNAAFTDLDTRDPLGGPAFYRSVPRALATLKTEMEGYGGRMDVDIIAVGHAHIDIAYLWRVAQTRGKCGRTFSNVLTLMREFEGYRFSQSQPLLYQFVQQDFPELFEDIRRRVAQGRWEVMGGMWVEPDCNLSGAESLVRQLLFGRSYFRETFGDVETPVLWLPDTFGFTASLPQLMKQAGLKWFVANKLNWNQYNAMPHQLLWWEGIDGTKVLAHFLTTPSTVQYLPHPTTYKAEMTAKEVFGTWDNFRQKPVHQELITCYGYGDGGGGPTRELITAADNYALIPGTPHVRMGTVREFFEGVERRAAHDLPTWTGEFYLELHRGTLTSQARTKRLNRKAEMALHDAEFVAALAWLVAGAAYPGDRLEAAWKTVCLNQFHDIIPGTSIGAVFTDAERDYREVVGEAQAVRDHGFASLAAGLPRTAVACAINATGFTLDRLAHMPERLPHGLCDLRTGAPLMTQPVADGTLVAIPRFPALSRLALGRSAEGPPATGLRVEETDRGAVVETDLIRVEIARTGEIIRLTDKEVDREVLAPGKTGNRLLAFEDRPMVWDAWDVDIFYEDRCEQIRDADGFAVIETGPLRVGIKVAHRYRGCTIVQHIYLFHDSKRIDFDTWIDWHTSHILLKVAFPVNVLSPVATYDIQFGNTERPTHRNTSWDWARFESVGHKWADLSEGDYGVALLNDCKYGYDIHRNVLRLSLLKSATMPDPKADQGRHRMAYSLLPHTGDWRGTVPAAAYDQNDPVFLRPVSGGRGGPAVQQLVGMDQTHVIIETVKRAEDGRGLIIRLYENERKRGTVTLRFGVPITAVSRCTLLEAEEQPLTVRHDAVAVSVRPYEIVTLRVT